MALHLFYNTTAKTYKRNKTFIKIFEQTSSTNIKI